MSEGFEMKRLNTSPGMDWRKRGPKAGAFPAMPCGLQRRARLTCLSPES